MLDFTDEAVSITSPLLSSQDLDIKAEDTAQEYIDSLSDPETTKATLAILAPWLPNKDITFVQDNEEFETNSDKDEDIEPTSP